MEQYQLPDGRIPIRFGKRRSAYYQRRRGDGEVRYTFSMIKDIRKRPAPKTHEELSQIARERAARLKEADPKHFEKIGSKGGKS